jgi:D-3-phosphoglycerate dehydrogenase
VAEQTLALLLGLLRGLPAFFRAMLKKEFIRRPTRDLHGVTVGIVGFGGNGRRIAEVLKPYRVRVLATDLFPCDKPDHVESVEPADRLDDVLPEVDVLILTVPLNEQTRGMIAAPQFARMKRDAIFINVARGPVVVERDLVESLVSGHLAGAGLDVTEVEPLPESSLLWDLPNVIITPHVGAQSAKRYDDATRLFCDNLRRYLAGEPLVNVVDKQLGFPVHGPKYGNWGVQFSGTLRGNHGDTETRR